MDKRFMEAAIREAREGVRAGSGGPFGAVVVKGGHIIGRGHNTVVRDNDPTAHGEVSAIRDACKNTDSFDLSGAELYTTCYPCPMCLGAILWARLEKVYYCCAGKDAERIGFSDNDFYSFFSDKEKTAKLLIQDIQCAKECGEIFDAYAASEKILY